MVILRKYTSKEAIISASEMLPIICGKKNCEIVSKDTAASALERGEIVCGLLDVKIPYAYSLHTIELENYSGTVSVKFKFDISIEASSELADFILVEIARDSMKTEWSENEVFGKIFDKCSTKISSWLVEKLDGVEAHLVKKYQSQAVADAAEFAELASVLPMPLCATLTDIEFFTTDAESKRTVLSRTYGIPMVRVNELIARFESVDDVEKILFSVKESSVASGTKFLETLDIVSKARTFFEAMECVGEIKEEFVKTKKFKEEFSAYGIESIEAAREEIAACGNSSKAFLIWRAAVDIKNTCSAAKSVKFEDILAECKTKEPNAVKNKYKGAGLAKMVVPAVLLIVIIVGFFMWKSSFVNLTVKVEGSPVAFEKIFSEQFGDAYTISDLGLFEASIKKSEKSAFLDKIASSGYELISSPNPNAFTARAKLTKFGLKVFLKSESDLSRIVDAIKSLDGTTVYSDKLVKGGFGTLIAEISIGTMSDEQKLTSSLVDKVTSVSSVSRNDIKIVKE